MKLGAMLVRDGRLTPLQVEQAVSEQGRRGGRLGTVVFELGMVDADTLTVYLGLELGIPIASRAVLDRAKRAAVRLLTPELAERYVCVPILVQDRTLVAAVKDPHDLLTLDELGMHTGYRVIPRVAPEIRLHYYIERYYGVPRPSRFRAMGDRVVEVKRMTADSVEPPPPPLPGLPPESRRGATPAPNSAPMLEPILEWGDTEDAIELAAELDAEPGDTAPAAPATRAPSSPPVASRRRTAQASLQLDDAVRRMKEASARVDVADVLLGHARSLFDVGVVCMVRDDLAFGWKGFGPDLDEDRIETLLVPLEVPSIFKMAVETNALFVGPAPPTAIHGHLFKILRTAAPAQAVVVPVLIRDRVVNLIYGHLRHEKLLAEGDLDGLRKLASAAAEAYARLIAQSRGRPTG